MMTSLDVIEVAWSGPHSEQEIAELTGPYDRGLLAIYGSHPVFGADALLYIDEARDVPLSQRPKRVQVWLDQLPSEATFYVGRLGGTEPVGHDEWLSAIARAHRLAVFFHSPPWNSAGVNHHEVQAPTLLLNVGRRHRLALEVSNLWDRSAYAPGASAWRPHQPDPRALVSESSEDV